MWRYVILKKRALKNEKKKMMEEIILDVHYLTEHEKREICSWRYEGDYAVYNLPSYEVMKEKNMGFMNPKTEENYRAYYHKDLLVGFTNIREEEKEVFIGIGVNPNMCGKGYGHIILNKSYEISKQLYPGKPLYLEVRTWNKRAISCYLKAGFEIIGEPYELQTGTGVGVFYRMVRKGGQYDCI